MSSETKSCQNCKKEFVLEPEDFAFYEKIKVPPPTFCPECRMQRRFAWRNERTLHNVTCAATGKTLISGFAPDTGYTIYDRDYWWSDAWDATTFNQEYDFSRSFFEQFDALMHQVPHPAVFNALTVNSSYTQYTGEFKDAYLVSASWGGENVLYSSRVQGIKDSLDLYVVLESSWCYECISCRKMANTAFCEKSENCLDSQFLYQCKGCNNCFGCTNLRNKSYYIFNEPYTKEEYQKKIAEFDLGSRAKLAAMKKTFAEFKLKAIRSYADIVNSPDSTGDELAYAKSCKSCFGCGKDMRDCKYVSNALQAQDSYDGYGVGAVGELLYELMDSGVQGSRLLFGVTIYGGSNILYSYNCHGCSDLFGCVSLRSKKYCIFNKQYSKEEYEELLPKVIEHMTSTGEYGEFFPASKSPFGYNETIAQDYFPITHEQASTKCYKWREREASKHQPTVKTADLPDHIKYANEEILEEIIECSDCKRPFRIIARELEFLRHFKTALPHKCFECRHQDRFRQVNFPRLHHRACMCTQSHPHHEGQCTNEFETSYAPDRPEIIYCEKCYQAEVV